MQAEDELPQQRLGSGRCQDLLKRILCWAVVILTMPVVNVWLVRGVSGFESVFIGSFLAVWWSFLAGVLIWRNAGMGVVLLVQLLALVASVRLAQEGIPQGLPVHEYSGYALMNFIMHASEAVMVVFVAGVMRLTL